MKAVGEGAGVLVVDKERGFTSHEVVVRIRRIAGLRRVGHCGTLDPLATGVLVVCLGHYTRLSGWISAGDKEYLSVFVLGATSTTGDAQGEIVPRSSAPPSQEAIARELRQFEGTIEQVPPAFSAVKVQGVRSYERARRGEEVFLKPRSVRIVRLELLDYDYPRLVVRMGCTSGTYVRSLAIDLGERLGCGAYVAELRRLRVGCLGLEEALTLEALAQAWQEGRAKECWVPMTRALGHLPHLVLASDLLRRFVHGSSVALEAGEQREGACAVFDESGTLCGIGWWDPADSRLRPKTVLPFSSLS